MGETARLSRWQLVVGVISLIVMIFGLGYTLWQDGMLPRIAKASVENAEGEKQRGEPEHPEVEKPKSPFATTFEVTRGVRHSQEDLGSQRQIQDLMWIRVAEPDDDEKSTGIGIDVELEIIGSEPCRLVLSPGQEGACGGYDVTLVDLTQRTATLGFG